MKVVYARANSVMKHKEGLSVADCQRYVSEKAKIPIASEKIVEIFCLSKGTLPHQDNETKVANAQLYFVEWMEFVVRLALALFEGSECELYTTESKIQTVLQTMAAVEEDYEECGIKTLVKDSVVDANEDKLWSDSEQSCCYSEEAEAGLNEDL